MNRSLRNPGQGSHAGEATRKQLIRREMRFVLQQDVRRFTKQLLARLLDEGCNLHPDLARIMFYERFELRLAAGLPADTRTRFCGKIPDSDADCTHPRYYAAVKSFLTQLPDAETQITATVLDAIEELKLDWQRIAKKCLSNVNPGDPYLQIFAAPWTAIIPGFMIFLTVLSINHIGDGLRDAFDPHKIL